MTTPFNLRATVQNVLDTSTLTDPGVIASKVLDSVPDDALRDCLRVTMRGFVRDVIRTSRATPERPSSGQRTYEPQPSPAAAGGTTSRSWKRDGIRAAWQRHLLDRYHAADGWRLLGEMTAVDLRAAAAEREKDAAGTLAAAARLTEWAALVETHNVACFGDLPDAVLARALGGVS